MSPKRARRVVASVGTLAIAVAMTACGAGGGGGGGKAGSKTVRVLMVNNPQMVDLQKLAGNFTKETGIKVDFKVLPENDVRDTIAQDVANQAGQYDVITISNFEVPFYAKNGWLTPLSDYASKDAKFDQGDILKPMTQSLTADDGKLYGVPFYGESSMLMYRKDIFAQKGLTMPDHPTWDQVAALAAKLDGAQPGMKGICLRGLPGWGEVFAPLTTVVNTFGGTWFTKDWQAQVNSPEFKQATNFYVDLVRKHGEVGAAQSGFTECLNNMSQGKVAMWYDATSAAGSLENPSQSKVAGKIGYAYAPVNKTKSSGWLYTWAWAIEKASNNPTTPGSSSPGPRARSTRSSSATNSAGPRRPTARASRCMTTPSTRRPPRRSTRSSRARSPALIRATRASSRDPRSGSSSSTSPSSPSSARTSPNSSARRSRARRRSTAP
jgi:sorbitol/mannitol transport system substrate-binding protein